MAASSRFATVSEDDLALKCFFFLFFELIACVFILKQLFASGSVIIGRLRLGEYSPISTSPSANNCLTICTHCCDVIGCHDNMKGIQKLLKDVRAKISNIDFFLQILPLKDNELMMSEM